MNLHNSLCILCLSPVRWWRRRRRRDQIRKKIIISHHHHLCHFKTFLELSSKLNQVNFKKERETTLKAEQLSSFPAFNQVVLRRLTICCTGTVLSDWWTLCLNSLNFFWCDTPSWTVIRLGKINQSISQTPRRVEQLVLNSESILRLGTGTV